ncbi:jg21816, partial [Pararge aegeria aegeria]
MELLQSIRLYSPDILALNETWLRSGEDSNAYNIPGYWFKHMPRASCRRGGGVGFYIRKGLKFRVIQQPQTELEQMWLEVTLKGMHLAVGTAYRPEHQFVNKSIEELSETLSALSAYSFQCLLTDFNINLLEKDSKNSKDFLEFLNQQNYTQIVQEPTRVTETTSTLLDLIITDTPTRCRHVK